MKIILLIIASILGAVLYRLGGSDTANTKARDLGVPLVATMYLYYCKPIDYNFLVYLVALLITFGLMLGSLTSYFKPKGQPVRWYNWIIVGLTLGFALFPYAFMYSTFQAWLFRTIFLMFSITLWSILVDNSVWEECGRGALIISSLILLI